jgi:O-antigen/teichoic acid export membrane protein
MVNVTTISVLKGGVKLSVGQVVVQACSFLRSVIMGRLMSPANVGIAATFAMTFYLLDMISNLAAETLLIQAKAGDHPSFENTAHLWQAARGLASAIILFVMAGSASSLFGDPQAKWAFRVLAVVPLISGFTHFDKSRVQRGMRFGPSVLVDVNSNVLVTLAALPLAYWLRDYSAMLWVLVTQAVCSTVGSHLVAERRYGWACDRLYARQILAFGWPLLVNGLLMFLIFQGDRFVIGTANQLFGKTVYSLGDLGVYSVAFGFTMAPTMMAIKVTGSLFLPVLSRVDGLGAQFDRRYLICSQSLSLLAAMISIPSIVAGGWLVALVYGQKYAAAAGFIGWLGAMWALRMFRVAPTVAATALGDTKNAMISNVARTAAFVGVLIVAAAGYGLAWIAACGFGGELLALVVCVWRLQSQHAVAASLCLKPSAVSAAGMAAAILTATWVRTAGWVSAFVVSPVLIAMVFITMLSVFPGLRPDILALLSRPKPPLSEQELQMEVEV